MQVRTVELEAANKELEAFSYSVSHDLRAPLRHIDGFARIVIESHGAQIGPEALKYLERIAAAAQNMGAIIEDLLKLAQVGRQPLKLQLTSLGALVEQVRSEFGPRPRGGKSNGGLARCQRCNAMQDWSSRL